MCPVLCPAIVALERHHRYIKKNAAYRALNTLPDHGSHWRYPASTHLEKKMARVWEDTIVMAMRDAQWISAQRRGGSPRSPLPKGMVKLDGKPESLLGDLIYATDERYFLFEVKGQQSEIRAEWVGVEGEGQKQAYKKLAKYWSEFSSLSPSPTGNEEKDELFSRLNKLFKRSLACHYFAYWDEWGEGNDRYGEIVIESYVAACSRKYDNTRDLKGEFIKPWQNYHFGFIEKSQKDHSAADVVALMDAFSDNFKVCISNSARKPVKLRLGLSWREFQAYINELLTGASKKDEGIHAVVLSTSGSFFRVVGSIRELEKILELDERVPSSPRRKARPSPWKIVGPAPRK